MAMDLEGASLTTSEVRSISSEIEQIGKAIRNTMEYVQEIMETLTGQSEGGIIDLATVAVKQLGELCETLIDCIASIATKIFDYLQAMINNDQEAADSLRKSTESRVY